MSDEQPKKKSALDNIIMGAIIGTAIGSAVGVSMAPKKGSETREILKEKSKDAGVVAKETATGFFKLGKVLLGKLFKKAKKNLSAEDMKEIPNEMEIIPPKSTQND